MEMAQGPAVPLSRKHSNPGGDAVASDKQKTTRIRAFFIEKVSYRKGPSFEPQIPSKHRNTCGDVAASDKRKTTRIRAFSLNS